SQLGPTSAQAQAAGVASRNSLGPPSPGVRQASLPNLVKQKSEQVASASHIIGKLHSFAEALHISSALPPPSNSPPRADEAEPTGIPALHVFSDQLDRQLGMIHEMLDLIVVQIVG